MSVEKAWRIELYADRRGESPVSVYLNSLSARERAEVIYAFRLLREFGILLGMPHARPISGHKPLWELRPGPNRIFYFAHSGRRFIMLHAYRKKGQKTSVREIRIAERRLAELLEE